MTDEGVLDPVAKEWLDANPVSSTPLSEILGSPEILPLARGDFGAPPTVEIAKVTDDVVEGVPVRFYEHADAPTGLVVYFHGGAWCIGSIGLMDNVARELAHATGAAVISVEYRLAPENPYPAGLDDCEKVTRWAMANAARFGTTPDHVAVAGESAGGNLSAAVALRLRNRVEPPLAAQVLMYPGTAAFGAEFPSRDEFDGIVISLEGNTIRDAYWGGGDYSNDEFAVPLAASTLAGLPPAIVVTGGCDPLRDEGRAYARRMQDDGVAVEDVCCAGQPHGFINFALPASADAFADIGTFVRKAFAS
jgi:acetyl esterase